MLINNQFLAPSPEEQKPGKSENKERLFKRKDEGYMSGTRSRQLRRKNHLSENKPILDKERSSSMSRLLDEYHILNPFLNVTNVVCVSGLLTPNVAWSCPGLTPSWSPGPSREFFGPLIWSRVNCWGRVSLDKYLRLPLETLLKLWS